MVAKSLLAALLAVSMSAAAPQMTTNEIVGGEPASQGDFPFIVSLSRSGSHFCGGSLLNGNTVLTAAHCAQGQTASNLRVRAGSLNRNSGGVVVGVSSIRINPSYSSSTLNNDVAILKLSSSIPQSSTIGYASLAAAGSDPVAGVIHTVAGWGRTSSGGSSPSTLQQVDVPVVSRTTCRQNYSQSEVTDNMWCAGFSQGGKDSCQGDSGGPIIDKSTRILTGVVSWGEECAAPNKPGVYTRIGSTRTFINNNL